jgi:hypothetical protein
MMQKRLRLSFTKRGRRRTPRRPDDPAAVFKTFVHVLAQMQSSRAGSAQGGSLTEKA